MREIVFNDRLNDFARKYLIKGNEHLIKNPKAFPLEYQNVINSVSEQLLMHDGISFKVYGENIPLALLILNFGVKGTEELIEQGALEFVLWNPGVTYAIDDIPGIYPLQSMQKFTSSVHSDPEASIMSGLNFMKEPLPRRTRRNITRKVLKHYKIPPATLSNNATDFGHSGYKNNLFEDFGLPKTKELTEFSLSERKKLHSLANQCLELTFLSLYQYSSYNSFELMKLNRKEFWNLKNAKAVEEVVDTIFNIEKIPDFNKMISSGMLNIRDIPRFRKTRGSKQFRTWITQVSHQTDKSDIIKEYIDSIVNSKTFFQTSPGKFTRAVGVTTLGVTGGLLAGPIGAVSGTVIGGIADLGISLFDTYILDHIIKGWNPRYYIDHQVRPLLKSSQRTK